MGDLSDFRTMGTSRSMNSHYNQEVADSADEGAAAEAEEDSGNANDSNDYEIYAGEPSAAQDTKEGLN